MAEDFLIDIGKENRQSNSEETSKQTPPPENEGQKPSQNKKYLKGCGCGCLVLVVLFVAFSYWVGSSLEEEQSKDLRYTYLKQDIKNLTGNTGKSDEYASFVKECVDYGVDSDGEVNMENIKYFTRRNGNKLLVLLKIRDLKGIEASSRRVIVDVIQECLEYKDDDRIDEYYICVEGKWNTLLVKTPNGSDLGGRFADDELLLPFYNEYVKDSLPSLD